MVLSRTANGYSRILLGVDIHDITAGYRAYRREVLERGRSRGFVLSMLFNLGVYYWHGSQAALEFLTGYLLEKSLSVDNIFVFIVVNAIFGLGLAAAMRPTTR